MEWKSLLPRTTALAGRVPEGSGSWVRPSGVPGFSQGGNDDISLESQVLESEKAVSSNTGAQGATHGALCTCGCSWKVSRAGGTGVTSFQCMLCPQEAVVSQGPGQRSCTLMGRTDPCC